MTSNTDTLREIFRIAVDHRLILMDARERPMRNGSRSSLMYQELTAAHQLVAHYRVWMHLSDGTPQRLQNGWEKYSPDGVLLDREVRYSNPTISDIEPAPISPTLH